MYFTAGMGYDESLPCASVCGLLVSRCMGSMIFGSRKLDHGFELFYSKNVR